MGNRKDVSLQEVAGTPVGSVANCLIQDKFELLTLKVAFRARWASTISLSILQCAVLYFGLPLVAPHLATPGERTKNKGQITRCEISQAGRIRASFLKVALNSPLNALCG
jgi:hypothetical protein